LKCVEISKTNQKLEIHMDGDYKDFL